MRSDYALYIVATLCFIITGAFAVYQVSQREVWIVTTAVLGLIFIGLGYSQRPKEVTTQMAVAPPPPPLTPSTPPTVTDVAEETKREPEPVVEIKPPTAGLLEVKGIGEKRSEQLRALGINTVEDLTKASVKELATKLKISPKITGKWIENAKEIVKKS